MTSADDKKMEESLSVSDGQDLFGAGENLIEKMKYTLAETVAAQDNPSIEILHKTLLEEFGQPASPDLVEYFKKEMKNRQDEDSKLREGVNESALQIVRQVVSGSDPSLDKLHKVYFEKKKKKPTAPIIAFFKAELKKQSIQKAGVKVATGKSKVALLRNVVAMGGTTLEKLETAFSKEFGIDVPRELIALFKLEVQKHEAARRGLTLAQYLVEEAKKKLKR